MAKKKQKQSQSAIPDSKPEVSEHDADSEKAEAYPEPENAEPDSEAEKEKEIVISDETLAEIGEPDKEQVFRKVAKAYEEAKRKREKYKKAGPIFVGVSGVAFLTLIFTLENKITFLIFWVITILYTVALMIRAEYKYHQFREYLGLSKEESGNEEEETAEEETAEEETAEEETAEEKQNDPPTDGQKKDHSQNAEQEERT